ncbi:MAG: TetR/AcrR family transcriptional regulator [Solirubrobacterales bacterium]|nr:TetR/AcrR family transcriptional regulator [Solirubrobacterales bacterium]
MARTLSTADARRETVLAAAAHVFAARGIYGTPTTEVARAAGISQAYLFRLYPSKEALAVALIERVHERIHETFAQAAAQAASAGEEVLPAMGRAYVELLKDQDLMLLQLHAHAASPDVPAIRAASRDGFRRLVEFAQRVSGAPDEEVQRFFAHGMLLNALAALDAMELDEPWARTLARHTGEPGPC